MNCYRTSNNKFFNAPPRMADARHFTDYRPICHVNNVIKTNNDVMNSYEYRLFLTRNANKLMESNRKLAYMKNGVSQCKKPYNVGTMLPEQDKVICNKNTCRVVGNDNNGLGRGRIYAESPSECLMGFNAPPLQLNGNKCTPPQNNFNYYPNTKVQGVNMVQRNAVPSGGNILGGGDPNEYH